MKGVLLAAGLMLGAWPAVAQTVDVCTACISDAHCETADQSCVPACEARYFTIDPKRSTCIAHCSADMAQCRRSAEATCREQHACR